MKTTNITISIDYLEAEDAESKKDEIIAFLRKNPKLLSKKDWEIYNELNDHFDFLKNAGYKINDPDDFFVNYFGGIEMDILDFQENSDFVSSVVEIISQERKKWVEKSLE